MKTISNTIPGYRVYEYLLVLSPHEELWNKIIKVKDEFAEKFKTDHARWGKPHVVLMSFVQYGQTEERIINRLNTVAMGQYPFKVELKDFGSFPSHTIYINVLSKLPVRCRECHKSVALWRAPHRAHAMRQRGWRKMSHLATHPGARLGRRS